MLSTAAGHVRPSCSNKPSAPPRRLSFPSPAVDARSRRSPQTRDGLEPRKQARVAHHRRVASAHRSSIANALPLGAAAIPVATTTQLVPVLAHARLTVA